ncbi:hypothetical protein [Paenibacillus sp. OAS669]|uniref:hypothetical protein n=1 Tax=Paenibacillus sp. OAS669 TaxID=2663821 RepID=UPI00178B3D1D|nr:hypothetical protein [Paenibacillus sp. OAS669]MBE1447337.1 hypothetical protein [Paenibacillus sp. OAS669]
MIRGVIIEGLSTAGKTSVLTALKKMNSQSPKVERTMIAVSEHYSGVLVDDHGVLRNLQQEEHLGLLNRHVDYIEQLHSFMTSLGRTKASHGVFYIFERFHLNHRAAFGTSTGLGTLEQRLSNLNALSVLLTISSDVVESRYVESRGENWKSYVMKGFSSPAEACHKFVSGQEKMRICAQLSLVATLEINTDNADWDCYADQIMRRLC